MSDYDDFTVQALAAAAAVISAREFTLWSSRLHPDFRHYPWASHTVIYQYRPWVVREIVWFLRGPIGRAPAR